MAESSVNEGRRMSGCFFFAVKSVGMSKQGGRKPSTLASAARHNLREIQAELGAHSHIDSSRTHLNEVLVGPIAAQGVLERSSSLMLEAGVVASRLRKDFCQAVEIVFSLPSDTDVDTRAFFQRCVQWAGERFDAKAIMSAVVHYDEPQPHAHLLISPIIDGRMCGSELITREALARLRTSFEVLVARPFKLTLPPRRLTGGDRRRSTAAVLEKLERANDGVLQSATWATVKMLIEADPRPFVAALGVEVDPAPVRKSKTFVQIMTSTGRGAKVEREGHQLSERSAAYRASAALGPNRPNPILCRLPQDRVGLVRSEGAQQ
jgi:hypothetical protein